MFSICNTWQRALPSNERISHFTHLFHIFKTAVCSYQLLGGLTRRSLLDERRIVFRITRTSPVVLSPFFSTSRWPGWLRAFADTGSEWQWSPLVAWNDLPLRCVTQAHVWIWVKVNLIEMIVASCFPSDVIFFRLTTFILRLYSGPSGAPLLPPEVPRIQTWLLAFYYVCIARQFAHSPNDFILCPYMVNICWFESWAICWGACCLFTVHVFLGIFWPLCRKQIFPPHVILLKNKLFFILDFKKNTFIFFS